MRPALKYADIIALPKNGSLAQNGLVGRVDAVATEEYSSPLVQPTDVHKVLDIPSGKYVKTADPKWYIHVDALTSTVSYTLANYPSNPHYSGLSMHSTEIRDKYTYGKCCIEYPEAFPKDQYPTRPFFIVDFPHFTNNVLYELLPDGSLLENGAAVYRFENDHEANESFVESVGQKALEYKQRVIATPDNPATGLRSKFRSSTDAALFVSNVTMWVQHLEVNSSADSFTIRAEIFVAWQILEEEYELFVATKGKFWKPEYEPQPLLRNAITQTSEKMPMPLGPYIIKEQNGRMICESVTVVEATCAEEFEVENFPFDVQYLNIHLQFRHELHFNKRFGIYFNRESFRICFTRGPTIPGFSVHGCASFLNKKVGDAIHAGVLVIRVQRSTAFFIRNVILMLGSLSLLATSCFWLENQSDKVSLISTTVLSAVAFQFTIGNMLPVVKYATLMDYYIFATFFYLVAVGVVSSMLPAKRTTISLSRTGHYLGFSSLGIWALLNVSFFAVGYSRGHKEKKKLTEKDPQLSGFIQVNPPPKR